jgi:hypothetical protein
MTYMLIPVEGLIEVLMIETEPQRVLAARDGQGPLVEINLLVDNNHVGTAFLMHNTDAPENGRAREAMIMLTEGVQMVFHGPVLFRVHEDNDVFDLLRRLP